MTEDELFAEALARLDDETAEAVRSIDQRLRAAAEAFNRGYVRGYTEGLATEALQEAWAAGFVTGLHEAVAEES